MESASIPRRSFELELDGSSYELDEDRFRLSLYDLVSTLLLEKLVDRASFILSVPRSKLDPVSASLYRHLKEQRAPGPPYNELEGETHAFRIHSVVDGLVSVHLFCHGGDQVPHFFVGDVRRDYLSCYNRGERTVVQVETPELVSRLRKIVERD